MFPIFFANGQNKTLVYGAKPTIVTYNATGSLSRFENKNIVFYFEKRSSSSCKFKNRRIGSWSVLVLKRAHLGILGDPRGEGSVQVEAEGSHPRKPKISVLGAATICPQRSSEILQPHKKIKKFMPHKIK
jgi:hypothetical protein